MQMLNDCDLAWKRTDDFSEGEGIFNGDVGFIEKIDLENKKMTVVFEDVKYVAYDFTQLTSLSSLML